MKFTTGVGLASLKSGIDLDIDKLKTVPVYLYVLSNIVENDIVKKTDNSNLVKKTGYHTKIDKIEKKIPGHGKYITTPEFNKFSGAIFA